MIKKFTFFLFVFLLSHNAYSADCVILLHGLAKSDRDMKKLEKVLNHEGYQAINHDYQSRSAPIEKLAIDVVNSALKKCPAPDKKTDTKLDEKPDKVHFVTHSMGGILVRYYLSKNSIQNLGRVVMLGPPNKGSETIDKYRKVPGFAFISGPSGLQLGTGKLSVPKALGKANFDVGIIAGTRSINLILSSLIPNVDDGKVSIESTKLDGMNDHIKMPVTHPFMMKNKKVIAQVVNYLKKGSFEHQIKP